MSSAEGSPILRITGLSVQRGNVLALARADLTINRPGEVHALLGQNGSGKSTLLGVLSGQLRPLTGEVLLSGEPLRFADTSKARSRGIAMVSQELSLAPELSVAENVLMGRNLVRRGAISWRRSRERAAQVLAELGFEIDPSARTGDLPADQRQLVEIARAIVGDPKLLVLDEPTSSLSTDEVAALFTVIRRLSSRGVSTIIVSHRLTELYEICDRITVLRDGETVLESEMQATTPDSLVEAMVGELPPPTARTRPDIGSEPVLELAALGSSPAVEGVDLTVRRGEVVGLAGLAGAGTSELLETIAGRRPITAGSMRLLKNEYRPSGIREALARKVAYLPPDRKSLGLHLGMSVADNLALPVTRNRPRLSPPRRGEERMRARALIDLFRVRVPSSGNQVGTLSGGNQQKIAIGKCVELEPDLLLLDEPTRGVDIAARRDIHDRLDALAAEGMTVLVVSSDVDELLELCHRIVVLVRGRVVGEVDAATADELTIAQLAGRD